MRLVGFREFCRMPAGTIFAPYEPIVLKDRLAIKTDPGERSIWCDWLFNGVMPLEPWMDPDTALWKIGDTQPASFEIYDGSNVDYSDHKMFLVFEEADIDRMINALVWAKNGCVGPCDCSVEEEE